MGIICDPPLSPRAHCAGHPGQDRPVAVLQVRRGTGRIRPRLHGAVHGGGRHSRWSLWGRHRRHPPRPRQVPGGRVWPGRVCG